MPHFAKGNKITNIVEQVITGTQAFVNTLSDSEDWFQTSFNTRGNLHYDPETGEPDGGVALRANFAGPGFTYDRTKDVFIPPKPFNSWVLNETTYLWESPTPMPVGSNLSQWDDENQVWKTE